MPGNYSPFIPSEHPAPFPAERLRPWDRIPETETRFLTAAGEETSLSAAWTEKDEVTLKLHGPGHSSELSVNVAGAAYEGATASSADLNRDGRRDYLIITHSGGNGLAGEITFVTFLISGPRGYIARKLFSYDARIEDLIDLDKDGRPEFIHTLFVWGEAGRDSRRHNYWVYNLVAFEGDRLVSANTADPRFPYWVFFTLKPNHRYTDQLTPEQRDRCWRQSWNEANDGDASVLPDLASDQRRTPILTVP